VAVLFVEWNVVLDGGDLDSGAQIIKADNFTFTVILPTGY
jgi:hypothetical protein